MINHRAPENNIESTALEKTTLQRQDNMLFEPTDYNSLLSFSSNLGPVRIGKSQDSLGSLIYGAGGAHPSQE